MMLSMDSPRKRTPFRTGIKTSIEGTGSSWSFLILASEPARASAGRAPVAPDPGALAVQEEAAIEWDFQQGINRREQKQAQRHDFPGMPPPGQTDSGEEKDA